MKFTYRWLCDYLETTASASEIAEILTLQGLEIEELSQPDKALSAFTVAYVSAVSPHPRADRLRLCRVQTGGGEYEIVCGAANAKAGMYGAFAPVDTTIPGTGATLQAKPIRGVISQGMLCSEYELGLSSEHDQIIAFEGLTPEDVGKPVAVILGLDDQVLTMKTTPNRGDALGVYGIARDLIAGGHGSWRSRFPFEETDQEPRQAESAIGWKIEADDNACIAVTGRWIREIQNLSAPTWMRQRLRLIGQKPISALVDITNYLTFDRGRPLHVFDADKIKGRQLRMRRAKAGEQLQALNGQTYILTAQDTVIADDTGVISLAGVIGGESTACDDQTRAVFLEAAAFDPLAIAATGRRHQIQSEARFRFERGVDPHSIFTGNQQGTALIEQYCQGQAARMVQDGSPPPPRKPLRLPIQKLEAHAGISYPIKRVSEILIGLGATVVAEGSDCLSVQAPSFRPDWENAETLVSEVLRITGLDKVPEQRLKFSRSKPLIDRSQRVRSVLRRALASRGLYETVSWSFCQNNDWFLSEADDQGATIKVVNPISQELALMRRSVLAGLLAGVSRNWRYRRNPIGLFELGAVYSADAKTYQTERLAGVRAGRGGAYRHWQVTKRTWQGWDAKADVIAALNAIGVPVDKLVTAQEQSSSLRAFDAVTSGRAGLWHPNRSAALVLGKQPLAWFGEINPETLESFAIRPEHIGPVIGFEIALANLPSPRRDTIRRKPFTKQTHPILVRDFSLSVPSTIPVETVVAKVRAAGKNDLRSVRVFDLFQPTGQTQRSVGIAVEFHPVPLTDDDINKIAQRILSGLATINVSLRHDLV